MLRSFGTTWFRRKLTLTLVIFIFVILVIHQAPLLLVIHDRIFAPHVVRHVTLVGGNVSIASAGNAAIKNESSIQRFNMTGDNMTNVNKKTDVASTPKPGPKPKLNEVLPPGIEPLDYSLLDLDPEEKIEGDAAKIPRIIHQFWDAPGLPPFFKSKVKSWVDQHPTWQYWFWQAPDVRLLLNTCFPDYFKLYKHYPQTVNRADAMRYFVLFTFGGLYLDLDMESIKPNDALLKDAPCVLTEETYEHSVLLYERTIHPNLINAYMASRPRHPLFKMAIEDLPRSKAERNHLRRTGPFFIDHIYQVYNMSKFHSPQGKWKRSADDVKILGAKLVMPTYDKGQAGNLQRKCANTRNRPPFYVKVCKEFMARRRSNKPYPESYANHLWTHTYMAEAKWKSTQGIPITNIVPNAVNITEKVLNMCTKHNS